MINLLTELQEAVAARIEGDAWMQSGVPVSVVTETRGDLASQIKERRSKIGLIVLVITPKWSSADADIDSINVSVRIGVGERAKINRGPTGTKKVGQDVALSVVAILWRFKPPGGWQSLKFNGTTQLEGPDDEVSYEIDFQTSIRVAPADIAS